jgi:hypothetical protein
MIKIFENNKKKEEGKLRDDKQKICYGKKFNFKINT